jgi:hypothetical protein
MINEFDDIKPMLGENLEGKELVKKFFDYAMSYDENLHVKNMDGIPADTYYRWGRYEMNNIEELNEEYKKHCGSTFGISALV